jgi:hypothetical protein
MAAVDGDRIDAVHRCQQEGCPSFHFFHWFCMGSFYRIASGKPGGVGRRSPNGMIRSCASSVLRSLIELAAYEL